MDKLTEAQRAVFDFVKLYAKKHGFPPTRAEISEGFGWASPNAAQQHLVAIERKGYVRLLAKGQSRGISILK